MPTEINPEIRELRKEIIDFVKEKCTIVTLKESEELIELVARLESAAYNLGKNTLDGKKLSEAQVIVNLLKQAQEK